ncbi:MAG: hypothetical protein KAS59_05835 [Alphaproteobacteria bacterium]|nr:hypothetical protein [Alphaproteobacteria bacterium]
MKKPRIIFYQKSVKSLPFCKIFALIGWIALKLLETVLPFLPILLIIGIFFLPKTPHIRWQYEYQQIGQERFYISCDYLGVRGTVTSYASNCPIIVFFEKSKS